MKKRFEVGDVIVITATNREYSELDYRVRVIDVNSRTAQAKKILDNGKYDYFGGTWLFKATYDTRDLEARPFKHDDELDSHWQRIVVPRNDEVWWDCVRFKNYEVSTLGRVRNKRTKKILLGNPRKGSKETSVYLYLGGYDKNYKEQHNLAKLVYLTFHGRNLPMRVDVRRYDEDYKNMNLGNLFFKK